MNKARIKKAFGRNYSNPIIEHLVNKGFTAPRGGVITQKVIQDIVTGKTSDLAMMKEIKKLVVATERKLNALKS